MWNYTKLVVELLKLNHLAYICNIDVIYARKNIDRKANLLQFVRNVEQHSKRRRH